MECPREGGGAGKPGQLGDLSGRQCGGGEQQLCFFDAAGDEIAVKRLSGMQKKQAADIARMVVKPCGDGGVGQRFGAACAHIFDDLIDAALTVSTGEMAEGL